MVLSTEPKDWPKARCPVETGLFLANLYGKTGDSVMLVEILQGNNNLIQCVTVYPENLKEASFLKLFSEIYNGSRNSFVADFIITRNNILNFVLYNRDKVGRVPDIRQIRSYNLSHTSKKASRAKLKGFFSRIQSVKFIEPGLFSLLWKSRQKKGLHGKLQVQRLNKKKLASGRVRQNTVELAHESVN